MFTCISFLLQSYAQPLDSKRCSSSHRDNLPTSHKNCQNGVRFSLEFVVSCTLKQCVSNSLGSNKIGDEGVVELAEVLKENFTVEQIQYVM